MALPDYRAYRPDAAEVYVAVRHLIPRRYRKKALDSIYGIVNAFNRDADDASREALAYMLATAHWETGRRMYPVYETYARNAEQAAARLERAWRKGKLKWVKTPYWRKDQDGLRWLGRGLVQITHKRNYQKFEDVAPGISKDPEKAMDPKTSAAILVEGMESGKFTGRSLFKYVRSGRIDFRNARKVVNPGDKPSYRKIERLARKYAAALKRVPANAALANVQRRLKRRGYHDLGTVDGIWGPRTQAAILAFRNDNGLPLVPEIDDAFLDALRDPETVRSVSVDRATATAADLRAAGSTDIRRADDLAVTGGAVGGGAAILGGVKEFLPKLENASGVASQAAEAARTVASVIQENAIILLVIAGGVIVWQAWKARQNRVEKHRTGEYVSR